MKRWADAQEKFESVTEIVSVKRIERIGMIIESELAAEADIETLAMSKIANVTNGITGYREDFRFVGQIEHQLVRGFFDAFPARINRVASALVIGFDQERLRFTFLRGVILAPDK